MAKIKFTQSAIDKLALTGDQKEAIWWSLDRPGFGYRLRAGGSSRYIIQYPGSRMTLGAGTNLTLAQADRLAKIALGKVAAGQDPQADKAAARAAAADKDLTFRSVANRFITYQSDNLRPSSLYSTRLYLLRYFKPLHTIRVDELKRASVSSRLEIIAKEHGTVSAGRAKAAGSAMYTWAIKAGLVDDSPFLKTNSYAATPSQRSLNKDELVDVYLNAGDDDYGTIIKLLLLTGQRRGEIGGLRKSEIDGRTITLPEERTKNGLPHIVHLSDEAYNLLEDRLANDTGRDLIFGRGARGYSTWSEAKKALDARLPGNMPPWNVHDLRRTVVTQMHELGVEPHIVEAVVNHISGHRAGVAGVYNKAVYAGPKAAALEMWANHVMMLVAMAQGANVTVLRPKGAA